MSVKDGSANDRSGPRLCENADTETNCATIESGLRRRRIIIAVETSFLIQCFVSDSRKSFSHSLGHLRTNRATILSVRTWGYSRRKSKFKCLDNLDALFAGAGPPDRVA